MRVASVPFLLAGTLLLVPFTSRPAAAEWPRFGRSLTTAPGDQGPSQIASDGAGGAIVAWLNTGSSPVRVFAQHVLASGETDPAWPRDGQSLAPTTKTPATTLLDRGSPVIVPDGAGGAIVAWQASFTDSTGSDIFAQHVLASGAVDGAWPENGIAVCTVGFEVIPEMVSDGAGGAIVTWVDGRSDIDIFAQHVLAAGVLDPRWPVDGLAVSRAPSVQVFPVIVGDDAGGAIIAWHDFRDAFTNGVDIYAQHVLNSGVVDRAWPVGGRLLSPETHDQFNPTITSDGAGGAIVAWDDNRDAVSFHPFAQHVLASGQVNPAWPPAGLAVSNGGVSEDFPKLVPDGEGGAIVTWQTRDIDININMHAQHVLATGVVDATWPVNGRALSTAPTVQTGGTIASDGAGGAIVAWQEDSDIYVQHVREDGALDAAYPANGRLLSILPSQQVVPAIVTAGPEGAIVTWADDQNGSFDIFALQVLEAVGTTDTGPGTGAGEITLARPSPNPAARAVTLRFALPRAASVKLAIFDVGGRRVSQLASGAQSPGEHALTWDLSDESGRAVGAGLYFARLEVDGQTFTQQVVTLR